MTAPLTALVSWSALGRLKGRSIAHTRWELPLCLLSSDWESDDSSNSNLMTRRLFTCLSQAVAYECWLTPSTVALTGYRIVYPSCILFILGSYLFLFIVMNQGFEMHRGSAMEWLLTAIARRLSECSSFSGKFYYLKCGSVLLFIHWHILQVFIGCFLCVRYYARGYTMNKALGP